MIILIVIGMALLGAAILTIAVLTAYEYARNKRIPTLPANTPRAFQIHIHSFLGALEKGGPFDVSLLEDTFLFIHNRYDCSDFLVNSVIRAVYAYGDKLDSYKNGLSEKMRGLLICFKYHWDQNGSDSLCTWSENHQILYAGLEYLAGHLYENEVFVNSGRNGAYHKQRGRRRVLDWCQRRSRFGFTEWYSNNYYLEDIAAMSNIQEFAPDEEVRHAMTQILHLILFDMATQSLRGAFVSTGGRIYENNKKSAKTGSMLNRIIAQAFEIDVADQSEPFNEELTIMTKDMDLNFLLNKTYKVPEVLKRIARDDSTRVIKASNSIDIDEGVTMGLFGHRDGQLAAQWEMEAFTNHQVFAYTMSGLIRNGMLCSEFFAPLKLLNLTLLKPFYGVISRAMKPFTDGKATQRANTYTYRTPHYMMATAQEYLPGGFSDQQHIWNCLLSDDVCVFATHPSGELQEKGALSKSPGYWVGNGRNPHAVQFENRIIAIYHMPVKRAAFESSFNRFTHAYFPFDKFDRTVIASNGVFGKLGDTYVALLSATPFERMGADELKQYGDKQFWICECSSSNVENFDDFIARCTSCVIDFDGDNLTYGNLALTYRGDFTVDGVVQDTRYARYDSEYCRGERGADCYTFEFGGERLEVKL
jgi:hypothetical protein